MRVLRLLVLCVGILGFLHNPVSAEFDDDEDEMIQDEFEDADVGDEDVVELKVPKEERPVYKAPVAQGNVYFADAIESEAEYRSRWVESRAKKDGADDTIAKYDGVWSVEETEDNPLQNDLYLVLKSKAKHHAVSSKLKKPFDFSGKPFVMQYEVKFQNGQECGGAYVKLLSKDANFDLKKFFDKTAYTIMFGPDKCGNDNKLHFIFRHKNPITGEYEEKHAKKPSGAIDTFFTDKRTHLFTLVVSPDNTFEIYVDQNLVNSGSLLQDFTPAVNPEKEIVDPDDKKPADWDEREKIPDPDATKPDDWDEDAPEKIVDADAEIPEGWLEDEPELIPDEEAEKPDDWDDDIDGEWEPPMISNPKCEDAPGCGEWSAPMIKNPSYKGKWRAPMIDNPEYKGKWKARMIPNPNFFEDKDPYKMTPIGAVGLELWSMSDNIAFDNFIITDDKSVADKYAEDSWMIKHNQELASSSGGSGMFNYLYSSAMERKWLFAVYVVVLLLPVVLLSVWLCPNAGPGIKQDDIARIKKADEATPDDKTDGDKKEEDDDDNDDAEETDKASGDKAADKPKKKGKGQLEADKKEEEGDAEDESEDSPPEEKQQTRSSPRKRCAKRAE